MAVPCDRVCPDEDLFETTPRRKIMGRDRAVGRATLTPSLLKDETVRKQKAPSRQVFDGLIGGAGSRVR